MYVYYAGELVKLQQILSISWSFISRYLWREKASLDYHSIIGRLHRWVLFVANSSQLFSLEHFSSPSSSSLPRSPPLVNNRFIIHGRGQKWRYGERRRVFSCNGLVYVYAKRSNVHVVSSNSAGNRQRPHLAEKGAAVRSTTYAHVLGLYASIRPPSWTTRIHLPDSDQGVQMEDTRAIRMLRSNHLARRPRWDPAVDRHTDAAEVTPGYPRSSVWSPGAA